MNYPIVGQAINRITEIKKPFSNQIRGRQLEHLNSISLS